MTVDANIFFTDETGISEILHFSLVAQFTYINLKFMSVKLQHQFFSLIITQHLYPPYFILKFLYILVQPFVPKQR